MSDSKTATVVSEMRMLMCGFVGGNVASWEYPARDGVSWADDGDDGDHGW